MSDTSAYVGFDVHICEEFGTGNRSISIPYGDGSVEWDVEADDIVPLIDALRRGQRLLDDAPAVLPPSPAELRGVADEIDVMGGIGHISTFTDEGQRRRRAAIGLRASADFIEAVQP